MAIVALGIALPMRAVLSGSASHDGAEKTPTVLKVSGVSMASSGVTLAEAPGVAFALPRVSVSRKGHHEGTTAVVASCEQLRRIAAERPSGCDDTVAMVNKPGRKGQWVLNDWEGHQVSIPAPASTVSVQLLGSSYHYASVVVPPDLPALRQAKDLKYAGFLVVAQARAGSLAAATASVLAVDPSVDIYQIKSEDGNSVVAPFARWMTLAIMVAAGLSVFALIVAGIDDAYARRAERSRLRVLGASRRTILASTLLPQIVPMAGALTVAVGAAALGAGSYASMDHRGYVPPTTILLLLGAAWVASAFVAAGAVLTMRADEPSLRTE